MMAKECFSSNEKLNAQLGNDAAHLMKEIPAYERLRPLNIYPTWISFNIQLPPDDTEILLTDGLSACVSKVKTENDQIYILFGSVNFKTLPTHWMYLPELPK